MNIFKSQICNLKILEKNHQTQRVSMETNAKRRTDCRFLEMEEAEYFPAHFMKPVPPRPKPDKDIRRILKTLSLINLAAKALTKY